MSRGEKQPEVSPEIYPRKFSIIQDQDFEKSIVLNMFDYTLNKNCAHLFFLYLNTQGSSPHLIKWEFL